MKNEKTTVEDEGTILSLSSLREAFDQIESDEPDGFDWVGETPPRKNKKRRRETEPTVPKLSIYDGSCDEPGDFVGEESIDFAESIDDEFEKPDKPEIDDFDDAADSDAPTVPREEEKIELSPLSILEAMLFVGNKENRPLTPERASDFMRNVSPEEITQLIEKLNERYAVMNCPYEIVAIENGFRLALRDDFESVRTQFQGRIKEARLNQSAIDVLSIVAYRQPVTAEDVQKIRKQPSLSILSQLVRRDLLQIERESKGKRSTAYYKTTDRFLRLFDIESLDELPTTEEIEEKM